MGPGDQAPYQFVVAEDGALGGKGDGLHVAPVSPAEQLVQLAELAVPAMHRPLAPARRQGGYRRSAEPKVPSGLLVRRPGG